MSALATWQRGFLAELEAGGETSPAHVALHRNNAWFAQVGALEALYPAVLALAGDDCFRALARDHLAASPSRSGDVTRVGEGFAAWIHAEFAGTPHEYFGDVAQLEWCAHEALVVRETPALTLDELARIVGERGDAAVLRLVDTARLVESRWPVRDIWEACASPEHVDLDAGPQRLRLQRVAGELRVALHSPGEFAVLQACARGESLGAALAQATALDPTFDASRALLGLVRAGALARPHE